MDEMQFERRGPVAVLTVNRPAKRNAMTWAMYDRLVELCAMIDQDDEIRVWVLRGAGGKTFVSGTDITQFTAFFDNPDAGLEYEARLDQVMDRLTAVQKPTISLIDGFALGGGLLLALSCDLRVATPESKLSVPCVRLGNCLSMANYAKLIGLIGPARTLDLVYTGRLIEAAEAQVMGLLNAVIPRAEIKACVMDLADTISQSAPITVRTTKEAVRRLSSGSTAGGDLIQACYTSLDFQEGIASFLEKRPPRWRGS